MIFYPTPTTPTTLKSSVVGVVGAGSFFVSQFRIICFILKATMMSLIIAAPSTFMEATSMGLYIYKGKKVIIK